MEALLVTASVSFPPPALLTWHLVPYAVVNVEQGKRYRLRIFALSCRPFFTFSIDNHNLTFIEADGILHDAVTVQNIDVYAAQRVSAVLNANQPVDNYWIRAPPIGGSPANNPNCEVHS